MKETYSVKPPESIIIGDPWYFETCEGAKLEKLIVNKSILPFYTAARVVLEESPCEGIADTNSLDMTIYIAPKEHIDIYLKGMKFQIQQMESKDIFVDTAKYSMHIDDKEKTIYTGADGTWGSYTEFYRIKNGIRLVDAMIITVGFNDDFDTMDDLREHLNFFFKDVQQIENAPEPETDSALTQSM